MSVDNFQFIFFANPIQPLMLWYSFGCNTNPYPADHDFCCFQPVLLANQITDIRNEMCV